MVNQEYANAYSEVLIILKYIEKSEYSKIPKDIINLLETNKNSEYVFKYDINKTLNEQDVSQKAKTIIAIFFRDYWATEYQKKKIIEKENYDMMQIEKIKKEKYNIETLFKNRKTYKKNTDKDIISNLPVEVKKQSIFTKIFNIIKNKTFI